MMIKLTDRERIILQWVSNGRAIEDIAKEFEVHRSAIDRNMREIRLKLQVETNEQAIKEAFKKNLIT